jgi:hypothetical protein
VDVSHIHVPDATVAPDHRGERPCADCGGMRLDSIHRVPDTSAEMEESRRRVGER